MFNDDDKACGRCGKRMGTAPGEVPTLHQSFGKFGLKVRCDGCRRAADSPPAPRPSADPVIGTRLLAVADVDAIDRAYAPVVAAAAGTRTFTLKPGRSAEVGQVVTDADVAPLPPAPAPHNYDTVRAALRGLGLDAERVMGSSDSTPPTVLILGDVSAQVHAVVATLGWAIEVVPDGRQERAAALYRASRGWR